MKKTNQKQALLFGVALLVSVAAAQNERWIYNPVSADVSNMASVVWGGGQFVAVGKNGAVFTSPDGNSWSVKNSGTDADLLSIIWAKESGYLIMGDSGRITLTSVDGISWAKNETLLPPAGDYFVGYASGKYFASPLFGYKPNSSFFDSTYHSLDGIIWEKFANCRFVSIAYGNNVFVGVTYNLYHSSYYGNILTSSDGEIWEANGNFDGPHQEALCWLGGPPYPPPSYCYMPSPPMLMRATAYGNNVFLVSGTDRGAFGWSEDGKLWNIPWYQDWDGSKFVIRDIWDGYYNHIIYDGVRFLIVKNREIYSTINGRSLEPVYSELSMGVEAIASDGNMNIVLIYEDGYVGQLTKDTSATVIRSKQRTKSVYGFTVRQSGKMLKVTMSNQSVRPQIAVYSLAGKRQKINPNFHTDGTVSVPLAGFAAGSYILRANDGKKDWNEKIVVK